MKTRIFFVLAAIGLLASCAKEQAPQNDNVLPGGPDASRVLTTLTVGLPNPDALAPQYTRTHMDPTAQAGKHKVYWSGGDQIAVNGVASQELSDVAEGTQTATFHFEAVLETPYRIVYPASISSQTGASVTLPERQTYKADGFAEGMYPMAGYSADGEGITLNPLCAMLKISVKRAAGEGADADDLVAVRFKGKNNEQVCGSFTIDYENATLTGTSSAAADKEVKVVKVQATSVETAAVYYVVVPAGTYSNGFDITVQDNKDHIMTQSKASSVELTSGALYVMPEFTFVPTATELGVEIASAEDLISFATNYNNKVYDALGDALIATLTADITFDTESSALFNATTGIGVKKGVNGTEDNYFNGTFNATQGNVTHKISGLTATVPLFVAVGKYGNVNDLVVDNTCSFTFTHPNTAEMDAGAVAGYLKGSLNNVTVEANVALAAVSEIAYETCFGGIVGRETEGTISGCTYTGAVSIPAEFASAAKKIQIGGIVGRVSNAEGKVLNSDFEGTLDNEGQMVVSSEEKDWKDNPYLMIGGIVGLNLGTVDGCSVANNATGVTVTLNDGSDHNYTGTVVTHSTNAYHYALAGIAGRNDGTVANSTNNAVILNIFSAARGTSGNMNGRYLNVGGIVGFNSTDATVSGCTNNASIVDRANPKVHYVGGIVGRNTGTIRSCSNATSSSSIGVGTSYFSPYGSRMLYVGGVVGSAENGSVSDVQNAAAINISRLENTTGIFARIGGVIGSSTVAIDGAVGGGTISNSGAIAQSSGIGHCATPTADNDYGLFLGGIVGYTTAGVSHVSNTGNVTYTCTATGIGAQYVHLGGVVGKVMAASAVDVEQCSNTAKLTFTASATHKANADTRYYYNYMGGIVGYGNNANVKGSASAKTTNSGQVKGGDGSDNNNQGTPSFAIGGIAGYLTGASSVEYCDLIGSGNPYNDHWSNRGIGSYDCPTVGGIVGQIVGSAETAVTVSHCSVASTTASINARRGAVGGIVGLSQYGSISDCTVPTNFSESQSGYFYGGIVAAAQNSSISGCTYTGTTIQSSQIQIGGGIVGQLDTGSLVDGCYSYATTINKNGTAVTTTGGIAGKSFKVTEAVPVGETIQNCHYTSAIGKICGDSNFTDGGGNVADL